MMVVAPGTNAAFTAERIDDEVASRMGFELVQLERRREYLQGMLAVPAANLFRVNGVGDRGGDNDGLDVHYAGASQRRFHKLCCTSSHSGWA